MDMEGQCDFSFIGNFVGRNSRKVDLTGDSNDRFRYSYEGFYSGKDNIVFPR
jgi:hypothetical protein